MAGDTSFGERMAELRRERGVTNPGRPRIVDKHGRYVNAAERIFAAALPEEAQRYLDELLVKEPERCEQHNVILRCPDCGKMSERTAYDHKAAAYVFDRIMGKPTTRTENTITVRLVQELVTEFVTIFGVVNAIPDADSRQAAFVEQCADLGTRWGSGAT